MGIFNVIEQYMIALWMCSGTLYSLCAVMDTLRINGETNITEVWKTLPCQTHHTGFKIIKGKKKIEGNAYFTQWGQFSCFYCHWISKLQKLRHKTIVGCSVRIAVHTLNWDTYVCKTWSLLSPKQLPAAVIHLLLQNCLAVSEKI